MPLRAGLLDRRVTLERRVELVDSYGQAVLNWVPVATVWARVEQLGGREGSRFGRMHSGSTLLDLFHELTRAGAEGKTEPRFLDPGSYGVMVLAEGFVTFSTTVEIAEGKSSSVEVRLALAR